MLKDAISTLKENGENHVNHRELAETQTGKTKHDHNQNIKVF